MPAPPGVAPRRRTLQSMAGLSRWCAVSLLVVLVVATPVAWRARPVADADVSPTALLERVVQARDRAYSGYVEAQGALDLPVTSRFTDIGALVGERTRLRVWWRSADAWRVDKLLVAGETDLVHDATSTTEWDYEDGSARRGADPAIRLPRTADLLPPALGDRLLDDVDTADLSRLRPRRVAGRDALGLRLSPGAPQSSIDHVDLWADRASGVPLRVEVYDEARDATPVLLTQFRSFDPATPRAATTVFTPPPGVETTFDSVLDIADAANQYAPFLAPASVAGLTRSPAADRAVGVYGTGVTQLISIPLRGREAGPLRRTLGTTIGSRLVGAGTIVSVGPLGVLLTGSGNGAGWLITGTVTEATLERAARDLATGTRYRDGSPLR